MADWLQDVQPLTMKGQISVPYTWSVGEVGSRFLTALRDQCQILGNRCKNCNTVYVPPRKNCGKCFLDIDSDSWVVVKDEGIVTAYSVVRYDHPVHPFKAPFAYAMIALDGADVGFMHIIKDNIEKIKNGARVKARFKERRNGNIMDIDSFTVL